MMFAKALGAEFLKLRRSKATWCTWIAFSFVGIVVGAFMWIARNPDLARRLGLLGQKADFLMGGGRADWPTFLAVYAQMSGVGGIVMFSIIVAYVFGREYAEGTAKNMLALPLPRYVFALAKLAVASSWYLCLCLSLLAESLVVGAAVGLSGFDPGHFLGECGSILLTAAVLIALGPAVAWVAVGSRGYLAPLGFSIFMLVMGSILGHTGWARWFPWSIIPLFSGIAGPRVEVLDWASYASLAATFALTLAGTLVHQRLADCHQ